MEGDGGVMPSRPAHLNEDTNEPGLSLSRPQEAPPHSLGDPRVSGPGLTLKSARRSTA
jgi:hypothetical protein